jgi:DNA-binding transcriptional MocR family regulator
MLAVSNQPGMISFAGGLPAPELFDVDGLQVATEAVLSRQARVALQYGPTEGVAGLRDQLARLTACRGLRTEPERIVVTTGAQQALELVGKVILDPGDVVLVERPTYTTAIQTFRLCGARVVGVDSDDEGLRPDALERTLHDLRAEGGRPRLLYVIPNYSNPAGWVTSLERRQLIAELAVRERIVLIEDDPYGDLHFEEPPPPPISAIGATIDGGVPWFVYLGSLSKVVAPGLRIGWATLPPDLIEPVTLAKQGSDLQGSTFNQCVAERYLAAGALARHLPFLRESYSRRCLTLATALKSFPKNGIKFTQPRGGLFLWAKLRSGLHADIIAGRAIRNGVVYVPGAPFFSELPEPETLRLTFATASEDAIEDGARRLELTLAELEER